MIIVVNIQCKGMQFFRLKRHFSLVDKYPLSGRIMEEKSNVCLEEKNGEKKEKTTEERENDFLAKVIKPYPHCVICKEKTLK